MQVFESGECRRLWFHQDAAYGKVLNQPKNLVTHDPIVGANLQKGELAVLEYVLGNHQWHYAAEPQLGAIQEDRRFASPAQSQATQYSVTPTADLSTLGQEGQKAVLKASVTGHREISQPRNTETCADVWSITR